MQQTEGVKHHCTALAELTKRNSTSKQKARFFSFAASAPPVRRCYRPAPLGSCQSSPKPDAPPFPKINSDRRCLHTPKRRERIRMTAKSMWVNTSKYSQQQFVTLAIKKKNKIKSGWLSNAAAWSFKAARHADRKFCTNEKQRE